MTDARSSLHRRIQALIARLADGTRDDGARDALLLELADYQRTHVAPYARFVKQRLSARGSAADATLDDLDAVPALPTDAFRYARISSRPEAEDLRTFRSSGTTNDERSRHVLQDLSLYDAAAQAAARYALFPDRDDMALIILAPHERELGDSSLSYMLARFVEWFGSDCSTHVWPLDAPELSRLRARLQAAAQAQMPVALLGTSFAFVHALDGLGGERFQLPDKSRIMQTGGFKGRSREVAPDAMRQLLQDRFGIAEHAVVAEYGMTELSSQLYENTLRAALLGRAVPPRRLWAPGWVRTSIVDPETLAPVPAGAEGLVRIDDLANLDSVAFVQASDLGVADELGIRLLGRAPLAVARGCSITADDLLSTRAR
ncbi:MAG: Acyl-protein synthetase [Myxococcaceae bacterium]|nr:Acyl-protein synthetase [Myxococcaceae bacterium]